VDGRGQPVLAAQYPAEYTSRHACADVMSTDAYLPPGTISNNRHLIGSARYSNTDLPLS
jgi:hypothetical protein